MCSTNVYYCALSLVAFTFSAAATSSQLLTLMPLFKVFKAALIPEIFFKLYKFPKTEAFWFQLVFVQKERRSYKRMDLETQMTKISG